MTLNSISTNSVLPSVNIPPVNSSSSSSLTPEIRPASRGITGLLTATSTNLLATVVSTNSGLCSPSLSEPVAGPSGLGPVQSVPLVCTLEK